eukprot:TRINITY_DN848_c0_g1_i1.p1 TRINITY_DN848_c0_g1~~TRINITY_DN848_c0_g1_i1.p1  ORF type:complete len:398 (+),score=116.25 TRINITY_DN848_c0_g1_i1:94-1287(+)
MGIKGLTSFISEHVAGCIQEETLKNYFGRRIAIDASMSLYQFLISVRPDGAGGSSLTNEAGETTSHLQGMFYRTIKMISNGIKPVFVFDGKPPVLKSGELAKRLARRKEATESLEEAKEVGTSEDVTKLTKRTTRVTKQHNDDTKRLLRLMGVPVIEAPSEAEAQCAALCKAGKVFATGSEDMDSLTLGTNVLIRRLTFSEARKLPILEFHLDKVLEGLKLTMDQFIDLCILLGCDYCDTIKGIGPVKAKEYIDKYGSIEKILPHLDKAKHPVPEEWPFEEVRELFKHPEVIDPETIELKWTEPDEEGLKKFLVDEMQFNEKRVVDAIEKLKKLKVTHVQQRLDSFFVPKRKPDGEEESINPAKLAKIEREKKEKLQKEKDKKSKGKGKAPATPKKK